MKKTVLFSAFLIGCITLVACQQKNSPKLEEANLTDNATSTSSQMAECEIKVGDVTFTRSINGADTCVSLLADGALSSVAGKDLISSATLTRASCQTTRFPCC